MLVNIMALHQWAAVARSKGQDSCLITPKHLRFNGPTKLVRKGDPVDRRYDLDLLPDSAIRRETSVQLLGCVVSTNSTAISFASQSDRKRVQPTPSGPYYWRERAYVFGINLRAVSGKSMPSRVYRHSLELALAKKLFRSGKGFAPVARCDFEVYGDVARCACPCRNCSVLSR